MGLKQIMQLTDYHTVAAMQLIEKSHRDDSMVEYCLMHNFKPHRGDITSNHYIKQFSEVCIKVYRTPIVFNSKKAVRMTYCLFFEIKTDAILFYSLVYFVKGH